MVDTPNRGQRRPSPRNANEERLAQEGRDVRGAPKKGPMREYRLKVGQHRHDGITYEGPCNVPSEVDLVKLMGAEKFAYLNTRSASRAPGGRAPLPPDAKKTTDDYERRDAVRRAVLNEEEAVDDGGAELSDPTEGVYPGEGPNVDRDDADREATEEYVEEQGASDDADLDSMTVGELRAYATERDIDLTGKSKKADIIDAIRGE